MTTLPAPAHRGEVTVYNPEADTILRYCLSGSTQSNGGPRELINFPGQAARRVLVERQAFLVQGLAGFNREEIADAVLEMLSCYSQYHRTQMDKKALRQVATKYVQELQGLPTWACRKACDAIRFGSAPNVSPTYPPSTIEVRTLAQGYTALIRGELNQIGSVLQGVKAPPQLSSEERKGLAVKFKALGDELRGHEKREDAGRAPTNFPSVFESHRFILREWGQAAAIECMPGVPVSKTLADKLASR
jgi:hypothetical protein